MMNDAYKLHRERQESHGEGQEAHFLPRVEDSAVHATNGENKPIYAHNKGQETPVDVMEIGTTNDCCRMAINRAESLLAVILNDGIFSESASEHESSGWYMVKDRFEQTGTLLHMAWEYLETALDKSAETERLLLNAASDQRKA